MLNPDQIKEKVKEKSSQSQVARDCDVHRQQVWDVISRKYKNNYSRDTIRVRYAIVKLLKHPDESVRHAYIRIWGEEPKFWFGELL
jgi:hypothetical protein